MTFEEFKSLCEKNNKFGLLTDNQKKMYNKELYRAKIYYENDKDLYNDLSKSKKINTQYVLPYLLDFTNEITNEPYKAIQMKSGSSGGLDIDVDVQGEGRDKIFQYLKNKYGEDRVFYVGTTSTLGPASAVKDLARVYSLDFGKANDFTSLLDKNETWEDNLKKIKIQNPTLYMFYEQNKEIFDLIPYFLNKPRQTGKHAGGFVILDAPVWNYIPVDRVNGEVTTAFAESGQETTLDEIGVIKFDILSISILDVISQTVDLIDEELYLIEENGIQKIVPESYLKAG